MVKLNEKVLKRLKATWNNQHLLKILNVKVCFYPEK